MWRSLSTPTATFHLDLNLPALFCLHLPALLHLGPDSALVPTNANVPKIQANCPIQEEKAVQPHKEDETGTATARQVAFARARARILQKFGLPFDLPRPSVNLFPVSPQGLLATLTHQPQQSPLLALDRSPSLTFLETPSTPFLERLRRGCAIVLRQKSRPSSDLSRTSLQFTSASSPRTQPRPKS